MNYIKLSFTCLSMLFFISFSGVFLPNVSAQQYQTAIGLRAGETNGLSIKQSLASGKAIEGIINVWPNGFSATLLLEKYQNLSAQGFSWYYGFGGHFASFNRRHAYYYYRHYKEQKSYYVYNAIGIDAIIGFEFKFPAFPLAISLDAKPYFELVTAGYTHLGLDPGLGIKLTF